MPNVTTPKTAPEAKKVLLSLPAGTHATAAMYAVAEGTSMTRWLEDLVIGEVRDARKFEEAMRSAKDNFSSPIKRETVSKTEETTPPEMRTKKVVLSLPIGAHATAAMYAVAAGTSMTRWLEDLVIEEVHNAGRFEEAMRSAKENFNSI